MSKGSEIARGSVSVRKRAPKEISLDVIKQIDRDYVAASARTSGID